MVEFSRGRTGFLLCFKQDQHTRKEEDEEEEEEEEEEEGEEH